MSSTAGSTAQSGSRVRRAAVVTHGKADTIGPALALAAAGWQAVVLVKPQFEAARGEARRGVVRDRDVWRRVLLDVARDALR